MNRRKLLSLLAVALVAIIASLTTGSSTASAQPIRWCGLNHYTVDLTPLGPGWPCYPLRIRTSWGGGATIWPPAAFIGYPGAGVFVENPAPVLPVGTPLDWVDVCGTLLPGVAGQYNVNCPGCPPLCVRLCQDLRGCLVIKVYPGPCPAALLPCP